MVIKLRSERLLARRGCGTGIREFLVVFSAVELEVGVGVPARDSGKYPQTPYKVKT